ncbi:MAG: restriction endonuclease subunit S, partial [Bacteroidales bacterium]|nr:restriction endonuclease subunit S [Bacteroidales bacterium]
IAELGSNTFMATNTNTVVLFLRRRDNYFAANTKNDVNKFFSTLSDVTINGIETPASKYVAHVWEGLDYADYVTLLQKSPNDKVKAHDIYQEYKKKISAKSDAKLYEAILDIEAEKLLYFILAYPQKVVIVKSGEKDVEKCFLGYEFSNRRGNEGIHAIQKGKNIDECTKLFDANNYDNPEKASTYVYRAFKGDYTSPIAEGMQSHINRISLVDMLTFDRPIFEKGINLNSKKKEFNTKWSKIKLGDIATIQSGNSAPQGEDMFINGTYPFFRTSDVAREHLTNNLTKTDSYLNEKGVKGLQLFKKGSILFPKSGLSTYLDHRALMGIDGYVVSHLAVITIKDTNIIIPEYLYEILTMIKARDVKQSSGYPSLNESDISSVVIPLPPIDVQKQIVEEIGKVDKSVSDSMLRIDKYESDIESLLSSLRFADSTLNAIAPFATKSIKYSDIEPETYITTDNMLQNKLGVLPFEGVANISSITEYKPEDILISNIRPYLKKIWFADKDGGCSKDVLVLRSADAIKYLPKYIFYMLRRDSFFGYVMEGKKGIKMPRGNKEDIMKYKIPMPNIDEQKRIVAQIEELELEITKARTLIENAAIEKQAILDKYL